MSLTNANGQERSGWQVLWSRLTGRQGKQIAYGYLFLVPWIIGLVGFVVIPFGQTIWQSLHEEARLASGDVFWKWVGIGNWAYAVSDDLWLRNYIIPDLLTFILYRFPLIQVFAMFSALMLNARFPGRGLFRALFFLPVLIYSSALYENFNANGAFAYPMLTLEWPDIIWRILQKGDAMLVVGDLVMNITDVMITSGVQILILLAALQSIPSSLYEAAHVDGCTEWEAFWKITLPMVSPFVLLNMVYTLAESFTAPWNLLPNYLMNLISTGRNSGGLDQGYASTVGLLFFLAIALLVLAVFAASRKLIYYAYEK